ncbi:MAG: TonB-dependent receptor [Sphingomonas bacterium]|nr:TonB-dependent receptor [Sphingomonas bacterium]
MTKISGRALYFASGSALTLGLALALSSPAYAQATTTPPPAEEEPAAKVENDAASPAPTDAEKADGDTIVVTGFRASLQSAVGTKKRQEQIVESVSAEDIGKLPDSSIGESIARLPGIASQRTNGRANVISIRGFGPDFSQTLLNGREQTSTNDNRGVEFDQYPSEVVSQVVVYKSPNASLVGQGLVGTVDIRTVRPLDYGRRVVAIGARGSIADIGRLNAGSKDKGYRVSATYVDQFDDDRLGVAVAASYVDEPYQSQEFNAWGYTGVNGNALIGGNKSFVTSTQLKRFGINGTIQAKPSDEVTFTFDGFYSNFKDDQSKRGIELPLGFDLCCGTGFNPATATIEEGQYVTGTFTNVEGVIRNDVFEKKADLYSVGGNVAWNPGNGWKGFADVGWSRTTRRELSLESYSGTGYGNGNGASDTIGFVSGPTGTSFSPTLNYSDPTLIRLTDPLGWGGSRVQAGYYNDRQIEDELIQYRAELEREFETSFLSSVKVGINYTDRDKSLNPDEFFVGLPNGATERAIPSQYLLKPTNLSYLGLGPIVSYNPRDLLADGVLVLDRNTSNDIPAKAYEVSEKLLTGYVQANIRAEIGAADLTGNVGVQVIRTDQSSNGIAFAAGTQVPVEAGDNYWHVLPSLNLNARLPNDIVVRFAASKQIQRPRLDQMRVAIGYGINTTVDPRGPIITGGGGNPRLRPYEARAFDFNIEKYFASNGYVALQLFHKKITKYIDNGRTEFDFSGFPLPAGLPPVDLNGFIDAPVNTDGGKMYGAELAATLPFSIFTSALDGFGMTGGAGYTKTKVKDFNGNESQIPGYSKWVANATLFYEKYGFNARGSVRYRSPFLGDFTGFGGTPTRREALKETIIDAQVGYDFQPTSSLAGLSLYIQGQNLTDERFAAVTDPSTKLQVLDYQIYGRRFLAGFTYKF